MVSREAEEHVALPLMRATWETLTFVHWPVPPERIQPLLPDGLSVDVYDDAAWVGLTPFVMADIRPLGVPDLPGDLSLVPGVDKLSRLADVSSTPETNLRTYVRGPDGRDGLWFMSFDIGNAALAAALRSVVGAPYHSARLTVEHHDGTVVYTGSRDGDGPSYRLLVHPGEPMVSRTSRSG